MTHAELATVPPTGSGAMFDAIAARYDLLNRILSMGIDVGWRRTAVRLACVPENGRALDVATGTADLALALALATPTATVLGIDPSRGMLGVGEKKVRARGLESRVTLSEGDAQALPYPDASFDAVTIAFGIRNVPDRPRALREMARVLRPGGRLVVLELSEPRRGILGPLARFHVHHVVPRIGALLSGAREYRYLQASIAAFPAPEAFAAMIREAGLVDVTFRTLTFGVAAIHVGLRP
jgi:demethylmenaquinone methyltransferase / 2-methoxy-6-polyprenyl-1,4-benzoquinol methylase